MKMRILVIGLGRLGTALAQSLAEGGAEVIALDNHPENLDDLKSFVHVAVQGDSTDPEVLRQVGASSVDCAVVCMGEFFESTLLTTATLLELKVPHVAARASTARNAQILKKIGAHEVFYVEHEMGRIMGRRLTRPSVVHEMELGYGLKIIEWDPPEWARKRSLAELSLPKEYKVQVITLIDPSKPGEIIWPRPDTVIAPGLRCVLMGSSADLQKLLEKTDT
jgi:trk system potassium uptake protein TrkA